MGPLAAALLNATFIQACELDDYHAIAPLHSEAIILPTLIAAAETNTSTDTAKSVSGAQFLLASIVGFEVGPRVGRALYGTELLSMGWHCGTVFGHPVAAAAASKLFDAPAAQIEDALGIACTQACGLMSAQYEGMVKRMQHGFSARNGLFGALLASGGYSGIKQVFERPYGGFLSMFSKGNSRGSTYLEDEVTKDLGRSWVIKEIQVKIHACVGCAFGMIECINSMQKSLSEELSDLNAVKSVKIGVSTAVLGHCGWKAIRPLTSTGAQMNLSYIAAVQFLDGQVSLENFAEDKLDRDNLWILAEKITCTYDERFDRLSHEFGAAVAVEFNDSRPALERMVDRPVGLEQLVTNEEIVEKYRRLTTGRLSMERQKAIEEMVLNFDKLDDIKSLTNLLSKPFVSDA